MDSDRFRRTSGRDKLAQSIELKTIIKLEKCDFKLKLGAMNKRSTRFPFVLLEEAVELLRKLDAYQSDRSKALKRPEILKALDYASLHGAAVKTIGAMRAYDLLEKKDDGICISPVGAAILDASSDEDRRPHLQKAALSPLTFRNLWRTARHKTRPELIELLLSRGFTEQGAKRASRIYRKNDELASVQTLELEPELPERSAAKVKRAPNANKQLAITTQTRSPNPICCASPSAPE